LTTCVLDASVAIKWFIPEVESESARRLFRQRMRGDLSIHVPDHFFAEMGNILWKKVRNKALPRRDLPDIVRAIRAIPDEAYLSSDLLPGALDLAYEVKETVYDGLYLALAVALNCELVTADRRLWTRVSTSNYRQHVRWVGNIE
jgi:predicted nucleic acid-binding protein